MRFRNTPDWVLILLTIYGLLYYIWTFRLHRHIYRNGKRCVGKTVGFEGRGACEVPVVEFLCNGRKHTLPLMRGFFGYPDKVNAEICVCYCPNHPKKLISDNPRYPLTYLFWIIVFGAILTTYIWLL